MMERERPILFSGEMVRAILEGRKTVTRRVVNPQPVEVPEERRGGVTIMPALMWDRGNRYSRSAQKAGIYEEGAIYGINLNASIALGWGSPYGHSGDRLWVRERWRPTIAHSCGLPICDCADVTIKYAADGASLFFSDDQIPEEWSMPKAARTGDVTPLYMPRWASRLMLVIISVRVERLHHIDDVDALAEGADEAALFGLGYWPARQCLCHVELVQHAGANLDDWLTGPRGAYAAIWDRINAKRAPWSSNPWVWRVEFKVAEARHDAT